MDYRYSEADGKVQYSLYQLKLQLRAIEWDRNNKLIGAGSICCGCCSVLSFILAFTAYTVLGYLIYQGIIANAVVTGPVSFFFGKIQKNSKN